MLAGCNYISAEALEIFMNKDERPTLEEQLQKQSFSEIPVTEVLETDVEDLKDRIMSKELLEEIAEERQGRNFLISPTALAIFCGMTQEEIDKYFEDEIPKEEEIMQEDKNIFQKTVDGVFTILELPVNITASIIDFAHDGKLDRPFLDNTFSAMYTDSLAAQGKTDLDWYDHVIGFGLDVLLDPTTYFGVGLLSKVSKVDDALKIAKGAGAIADLSKVSKIDDALKAFDDTKKVLNVAISKGETLKETQKALAQIQKAEDILKSESQVGSIRTVLNRNMGLKKDNALNQYIIDKISLKNNPNLITPQNVNKTFKNKGDEWGNSLYRAVVNDDVKLVANSKIKKQRKQIKKVLEGNYSDEIKKLNKEYETYIKVAKPLEDLIENGITQLTPKQIETIARKTGLSKEKAKYALQDYQNIIEKMERALLHEEIQESSLKAIGNFFFADSINEVSKITDGVENIVKREATKINKLLKELAKDQNIPMDSLEAQIIDFLDTGNKNFLNEDSLKLAQEIKMRFDSLHRINETSFMGNLARVKEIDYIPRSLKKPTQEASEKFIQLKLTKSKARTSKDQTFFELQKELKEKGIGELNTNIAELIAEATRKASNNAKLSQLKQGTKKYRLKTEIKGSLLTGHDELRSFEVLDDTAENILNKLKNKISPAHFEKIKDFNLTKLKEELPKLLGEKKAKNLLHNISKVVRKTDTYYPKPIMDKLDYFFYKNKDYNDLPNKIKRGVATATQAWKKWTLAPVLGFHANSMIDNANILYNVKPTAYAQMGNALDLIKGKNISVRTPYGEKIIHLEDFMEAGITGGKYSASEFDLLKKVDNATKGGKVAEFLKGNNKLIDTGFNLGSIGEDIFRVAYSLEDFTKGIDLKTSAKELGKYFYDPSKNTEFIRAMSNSITPFGSWFVFNIKNTFPRYAKSIGRATMPLKAVNASQMGEQDFLIKDKFTDTPFMFRMNASDSLDVVSKFSQLDLLNIADRIFNSDNPLKGGVDFARGYLGPFVGLIEAMTNKNFRADRNISTFEDPTDTFWGIEMDKRAIKAITSISRLASIINNFSKDSEGNFLLDTFRDYGLEKGRQELFDNFGYLLLGSSFTRDLEKSGNFAIRAAGEQRSLFQREMKKAKKLYSQTGDKAHLRRADSLMVDMREARDFQNTLRREMPKIKQEQRKIEESIKNKYDIDLSLPSFDLVQSIKNKNDDFLSEETKVKLSYVYDGDTVKAQMSNGSIEYFRLAGIDTPEKTASTYPDNVYTGLKDNKTYYDKAKEELKRLLKNAQNITVKNITTDKRDKFGRPIVQLMVDGIDVNKYLVENGFAQVAFLDEIKDDDYREELKKLALEASKNDTGFWNNMNNKEYYKTMLSFQLEKQGLNR